MSNDGADTQNLVPSSLVVELQQCQQHQDNPIINHNSLEAFPPSFTALLSNCYSSSEQGRPTILFMAQYKFPLQYFANLILHSCNSITKSCGR